MFKNISVIFTVATIVACGMDTQIVNVVDKQNNDSGDVNIDTFEPGDTATDQSDIEDSGSQNIELEGIVGYANYMLQQVACPECVGAAQGISLSFSAEFHQPITDTHTDWIPQPGECVQNLPTTSPSINPIDVGSYINVFGPVHNFTAPKIGNSYQTTSIYETQYDRDSTHVVTSDILIEGFDFSSSRGFDYIEPVEMLYVDMSYAYQAPIYRSGATFYWGPSGSDEKFMVIVAVYTSNGTSLIGYTTCVGEDIGYLTIPGTYLSPYPPGSLVAIHLSRQSVKLVPSYDLGGYIETHMEWEVVGTGYIQ